MLLWCPNLPISFMSTGYWIPDMSNSHSYSDILKLYPDDFCTGVDETTLTWTAENISCHYFEY